MNEREEFGAIVLAAGKGTRMNSELPKVLHPVLGRPMILYIMDALGKLGIDRPVVILGFGAEKVRAALGETPRYALQAEQLGSGHAVQCAREVAEGIAEHFLILCGDSPLFRLETMQALMESHRSTGAAITLTSAILDVPTGYGRIERNGAGEITGIVEERDASEEQKQIREVNGGLYAFESDWLWENLPQMRLNQKGEYCLTDLVGVAISQGRRVGAIQASPEEVEGVNTPAHLARAEEILRGRL